MIGSIELNVLDILFCIIGMAFTIVLSTVFTTGAIFSITFIADFITLDTILTAFGIWLATTGITFFNTSAITSTAFFTIGAIVLMILVQVWPNDLIISFVLPNSFDTIPVLSAIALPKLFLNKLPIGASVSLHTLSISLKILIAGCKDLTTLSITGLILSQFL